MTIHLLFLVFGGVFVWWGAEWLVDGAVKLARYLGVSSMVVGLTVVAFGTSAPELVVSSMAAIRGHTEISLGNVLGSNIINIGLVLGVTALISAISITRSTFRGDLPLVIVITGLVVTFAVTMDGISRLEGIVLLGIFGGYTVYTFIRGFRENRRATLLDTWNRPELKAIHIVHLLVGIPILALGAEGMVRGAVGVAHVLGISTQIVAMTVVAFGTSLPELAASVVAARHGESDLAVGNILGSNFYNMTLILGMAATLRPIDTDVNLFSPDIIFFVTMVLVLIPMMRIRWQIGRIDGALLVLMYIISVPLLFL